MSLYASCSRRVRGFFHIITLILLGLQVNSDERFCLVQPVGYRLGYRLHFVSISRANFQLMTSTLIRDMGFHEKAPTPTTSQPRDLPPSISRTTPHGTPSRSEVPACADLTTPCSYPAMQCLAPTMNSFPLCRTLWTLRNCSRPKQEFSCDPSAPNLTYPRLLPPPARMPRALLPFPE